MTLKFTPNGKLDRSYPKRLEDAMTWDDLADALDECVRRLRAFHNAGNDAPYWVRRDSFNTLLEIGAEP